MSLAGALEAQHDAELRRAARALLARPLLRSTGPTAEEFRLARQYATELRTWFDRNTGWSLHVDAETVRLAKVPGDTGDTTHPAREAGRPASAALAFTRRRYVLVCLALAALERSEAQIALGKLAEQVVLEAANPGLAAAGIAFTLENREERTDLVAVVRLLLHLGVLERVAGDEDAYVSDTGDVLYDVHRRVLAGMLTGRRGPSTVAADDTEQRIAALVADTAAAGLDSEELRNRAIRHTLTRRLLDDPMVYYDTLTEAEAAYLTGQRSQITRRITELTGLVAEVRAEGIAMVDPDDALTDVRMPEQGTHGHVTLLLAEHLAVAGGATEAELRARTIELAAEHGGYWSKTAQAPGAEAELVARALDKLAALGLVRRTTRPGGEPAVVARPALARYAVTTPVVRGTKDSAAGDGTHQEELL